jgi:hypothetical protein
VLNRIFDQVRVVEPEPSTVTIASASITDVEVRDLTSSWQTPAPMTGQLSARSGWWLASLASLTTLGLLVGAHLLIRQQQALQQERNLVLLSQLRQTQFSVTNAADSLPASGVQAVNPVPPAPPSEPWMEELAKLPQTETSTQNLLKVPLHGPLAPANIPSPAGRNNPDNQSTSNDIPQLIGVIQGAGKSGSAIFQTGSISSNVASGEAIGSSGWKLQTTSGDSAIIVRGGQQRKLSISTN